MLIVKWMPVRRGLSKYAKLCVMAAVVLWPNAMDASQSQSLGEQFNEANLEGAPPQNHVVDHARVFDKHPASLAKVVDSLTRMSADFGYPVYLVLYKNVPDASLRERADELYEKWIGQSGRGMVVVHQLDPVVYGDNPAMAFHKGDGLDLPAEGASAPIPERDILAILSRINPRYGDKARLHDDLGIWALALEREMGLYLDVKPQGWKDAENLMLIAVFAGFVITIPLVGMLIHRLFLASSNEAGKTYYFPEVHIARRLGAPYGGGWTSERSFGSSPSQP